MKDINSALSTNQEKLVVAVSKFFGKPVEEVRAQLAENLQVLDDVLPTKKNQIQELETLLQEKTQLEENQKIVEEANKIFKIGKEVLASLPEAEQQRMAAMRSGLQKNYGDRYEISYKQAIMKLHNKEVVIATDSVQFLYAHKELYKQELQLSTTEDGNIYDSTYEDSDGKNITRRELRQKVLDEENKNYHFIQEAQEELKQQGKYIATKENTFNAVFEGFEGEIDQKIKAMQFLTGFVGRGIVSLEKDENNCRRFLASRHNKYYTSYIYDYNDPDDSGSLFVAKDC